MTTLIISDLHLGAYNCHLDSLAQLLRSDYDRLIINGDTVDHFNFKRFLPAHWNTLHLLQGVARERELVLIRGNHDGARRAGDCEFGPLRMLGRLLGVEPLEDYDLRVGRRRYLVLHGDQFDSSLNMTRVGAAADSFYRVVQRCSRPAAGWLKGQVKRWTGVIGTVKRGAVELARRKGYQGVIAGHTHFFDDELVDDIHFLNTGCWVDLPCSYLLARDGQIKLHHVYGNAELMPTRPHAETTTVLEVEALTVVA